MSSPQSAYLELKPILKQFPRSDCPKGWSFHVLDGYKRLISLYPDINILQIKEKFGGLRIYYYAPAEQRPLIDELIYSIADKCLVTCMRCGQAGEERNNGWISVLCDECFAKKNAN